jgi:hypothetical protein
MISRFYRSASLLSDPYMATVWATTHPHHAGLGQTLLHDHHQCQQARTLYAGDMCDIPYMRRLPTKIAGTPALVLRRVFFATSQQQSSVCCLSQAQLSSP